MRVEQHGDVIELVLVSPPRNLFDHAMRRALHAGIDEAREVGARAVVLRAEGDCFTAGADPEVFAEHDGRTAPQFVAEVLALAHAFEELPCPTIVLVHGLCLTAGLELALACDLVVATRTARFGLVEAVVGLTPLMGGTQRLTARAGAGRALELVLTGGLYRAPVLHEWGVVNRVVEDEDALLLKGRALARKLAAGPTRAHVVTRRVVLTAAREGVAAADAALPALTAPLFDTADLDAGLESFRTAGAGSAVFVGR